ncbi:hypothetical protein CAPTEDRAFT_190238 [Capitella teleta]|uniref:Uncharacterized protein n=1 Tax=Capitella teleta TaxID=283909 RepID=R7VBJ8_CAPTE|nr:hypothetical protein CAPTEDRAFT_190238 [Capitella teleta]|eukprot:ELU13661.1 hypothetical protein CAPTEDRAFT_190238 [Capitella teleta]
MDEELRRYFQYHRRECLCQRQKYNSVIIIINISELSEEDKKNPAKIYEKFEELLNIFRPNFRAARLDYFYMRQQKEETLDAFYIRCREKAKTCDFEPEEEKEFFLILLVASTPLKDFQKWLISQKKTVTLEKVLAEGRSYEAQALNVKHIHEREKTSVDVAAGHWEKQCLKKQKSNNSRKTRSRRPPTPHRGSHKRRQRKVDVVAYDTEEEITEYDYDSIEVGVTVAIEGIRNEAYTKIAFRLNSEDRCRRTVKVKVDTGAQGNTLPLRIYHQLFPDDIGTDGLPSQKTQAKARNVRLKAYNGTLIPCFGQVRLQCLDHNSRWSSQTFFVVDVEGPAVAGLPMAEKLGLVILSCNITTDTVAHQRNTNLHTSYNSTTQNHPGIPHHTTAKSNNHTTADPHTNHFITHTYTYTSTASAQKISTETTEHTKKHSPNMYTSTPHPMLHNMAEPSGGPNLLNRHISGHTSQPIVNDVSRHSHSDEGFIKGVNKVTKISLDSWIEGHSTPGN